MSVAAAHTFAPSLLELTELEDDRVAVRWKQPLLRVTGSDPQPVLPVECIGRGEPDVIREGTGLVATWLIQCDGGLLGKSVGVTGIASTRADALLRIEMRDGRTLGKVLTPEEPGFTVTAKSGGSDVFLTYGQLGLEHILSGWDHLLFIVGLTLLVGWRSKLFWTVTAFTLGHSVTLALAVLDVVAVPQNPVELAIAASIYLLAVELARKQLDKPPYFFRAPAVLAGLFGLLHGLGFAGALREVGLPASDLPLALLAFNLGIEVGQLLVILLVIVVLQFIRRVPAKKPAWIRLVPAYAIGGLAVFWLCERLLL